MIDRRMGCLSVLLAVLLVGSVRGQKEAFVNQVYRTIVDSSFRTYRLSGNAYPCSFLKFEYDDWVKYALLEEVPIYVLNELAAKSFADRSPLSWKTDSLAHAVCIGEDKIDSVLDPSMLIGRNPKPSHRQNPPAPPTPAGIAAAEKAWQKLPPEQRTVFYFSRPLFTEDGSYAILDMDYRCDNRVCGMGFTCLFRKTDKGWRLVGKKQNW